MKAFHTFGCGVMIATALALTASSAWGRGGLGGGGGRMSGRFSGSRPSLGGAPSFSRPSTPASRFAVSRPATGVSHPSLGGRPSTGGQVTGLTPGSRPAIGSHPTQSPAGERSGGPIADLRPGTRPGVGQRPEGPWSRPGISTLPAAGVGTGLGAIAGTRPATLPGLGGPDRWQQIRDNRPEWVADRRQDLQNRLDNRHDAIRDWQGSRQDFLTDRREDWQRWLDDRYPWHDGWHHGYWYGPWQGYWEHLWEEHPVWAAFGLTGWVLNSVGYTFGLTSYVNPYYDSSVPGEVVYDYSQPLVATADSASAAAGEALPPGVTKVGLEQFDQARAAFSRGDYAQALQLADQALKSMPNDAVLHEFRALCLFALGQVRPAAAALHAVLAVGPGWDWTTLASLYPDVDTYTKQLRKLEQFSRSQPNEADAHFVLAYHYLTMGHTEAAASQLARVIHLVPNDQVARQLYEMLTYQPAADTAPKPAAAPASAGAQVTASALVGTWKATGPGKSTFEMTITQAGEFTWKYTKGSKQQTVRGVFALDADTLAMEPESGGVLVAQIKPLGKDTLEFKMVGAKPTDPPLKFTRM
jgi:tetratricopeptide (TPR) repeat protein